MSIVRQDTFTRANASSWGTASDGNTWTAQSGGTTQSIVSNEGEITGSSSSTFATLGAALATADGEGLVRFECTGSTTNTAGILIRWSNSSNYYLGRYDGAGHVELLKKVAGTSTHVNQTAFTPTLGTKYWLRFHVKGTTVEYRHWQDGTTEPSTWDWSGTDSSLNGSTNFVGLYGYAQSTNTTLFDSFSVDDLTSATNALAGTVATGGALSGAVLPTKALAGTLADSPALTGTFNPSIPLAGHFSAGPGLAGTLSVTVPGTGIGSLAVTTKSQSWSGGPAGSPGTETDVTYTDVSNSGWTVGFIPSYGGMPVTSRYEVDTGTTQTNETNLTTSSPDGGVHWLEQSSGAVYAGSEDPTFKNAGDFTELAPTGTSFRRYYKAVADANDGNGFAWTTYACVYPGDPGKVFLRFDLHNPSGSAIALAASDSLEIALLGGLEQADTNWAPGNGKWNTLGGTEATWSSTLVSGEPDYAYIPSALRKVGLLTAKATSLSGLGWSSLQNEYLQNASRLKFKVQGNLASVAAGATQTVYLLHALRRSLTAADAAAIAADYISPGTPNVTAGTFTGFSYDEGAYVFAGTGNHLNATLDLTPAHVTARYKPVIEVTGWTAGMPVVTWGGTQLQEGVDYRFLVSGGTLYLQLYFDVVASGAVFGQRNNAALDVRSTAGTLAAFPALSAALTVTKALAGTLPGHGALPAATLSPTKALVGTLTAPAALHGTLGPTKALRGTVSGAGGILAGSLRPTKALAGLLTGAASLAGSLLPTRALRGTVSPAPGLSGALTVPGGLIHLAGTVTAQGALTGTLHQTKVLSATLPAGAALTGTLRQTAALRATAATGASLSGSLTVGHPATQLAGTLHAQGSLTAALHAGKALAATLPAGAGLAAALQTARRLSGTVPGADHLSAALTVGSAPNLLVGTVHAAPALSGALQAAKTLAGTLPATGAIAGSLHPTKLLAGTVPSGAHATGSLFVAGAPNHLAGPVPASGSLAGSLRVGKGLSATLPSAAGTHGALFVGPAATHLSGYVPTGGYLSGALRVTHPLAGALATAGALRAALTVVTTPPFTVAFALQSLLTALFAASQSLTATFSRSAAVVQPNSTVTITATASDLNGNPVSSLSAVAVTVTFPDGTTATFTLSGGQVTNAGNGKYTLTYTTKGVGECLEDWTFTGVAGTPVAEYHNITPVSF